MENYLPLTLAKVYDALSYYHEHESEIEVEIAANEEALAWVTRRSMQDMIRNLAEFKVPQT